ncbi:hypothetical protein MSG28_003777 [Choristoneura fumiferana]|uniref:Uncharacterized protein n=1 Tax=Choristoneura fumiferana TaxID=7141 RepID=A0ACC0KGX2_CHOFU|nr:hypothetical protein MSG28_003777 [Choristoneura fumiferana]
MQLNQNHSYNVPQDLPAVTVPSSNELVKAVRIATADDDEILTANDIITPVINFADKQNKNLILSKKNYDNTPNVQTKKCLENHNFENNVNQIDMSIDKILKTNVDNNDLRDVNWADMFDTELFQDLNKRTHTIRPDIQNKENHLILQNSSDAASLEKNVEKNKAINIISTNKQSKKRNLDQMKDTKTITKNVKQAAIKEKNTEKETKNNFRKVKYTKAVKNWLNNFDPIMQYEDSPENIINNTDKAVNLPVDPTSNITKQITSNDNVGTPAITESTSINIEKKPKEKSKKVVQATLAQKDGKMKFKLPIKDQTASKPELADKKIIIKDTVKEKKAKPKFIAPIKSQIPVKSVQFDVCTVNESNLQRINSITDAISSDNNELVMVLVYSEIIKELIEKFTVICYNGKQLLIHLILNFNIELEQYTFNINDAKIGGSLIDPDSPPENFADLQTLTTFTPEYTIATDCVLQKTAWYSNLLKECFAKLKTLLTDNSLWNVFVDIEMPLVPIIAGMEHRGVTVDSDKLKSMEEILLAKMNAMEQECYKAAGKTFQINSALQVRTILYDELQLDTKSNLKIKETIGIGAKSTSETMLRGLVSVHPLPRLILEYRHLHKAHATFVSGIAQHVKNGLVKPTWVQTAAATGRIASSNPNLQAIPKSPFSLVLFPDDGNPQEAPLNFRSVYTARAGHELLAADFKHIECRVFALCAGDDTLLAALQSDDLFRVLAAQWLGKAEAAVRAGERARTKRVVYASLYGAGARTLADILQEPYHQVLPVLASFHRTFPSLQRWARATVSLAARGALRSLTGRARRLPRLASADAAQRAHAERQAINFVVQASAADLCKKAMAATARRLRGAGLPAPLLLQIHDELLWELPRDHLLPAAAIIKEVMENIGRECGLAATLPVQLARGPSWGELQPLSLA